MSEVRAHLESALRQMDKHGIKPKQPIDIDAAERHESEMAALKQAPATKDDVDLLLRRIADLERQVRAIPRELTFTNAIAGERDHRGVHRVA